MKSSIKLGAAALILLAYCGCASAPVDSRTRYVEESRLSAARKTPASSKQHEKTSVAQHSSEARTEQDKTPGHRPPKDDVKLEGENTKSEGSNVKLEGN